MRGRPSSKVRVCAAVSGRATVLRAVIEAAANGLLSLEVCGFVADRSCDGLRTAADYGIPGQCLDFKAFPSRTAFHEAFDAAVLAYDPDFVLLHYNRLVSDRLLEKLPGRVINTHYSLLPAFPGFRAIPRALETKVRFTGVTIHTVTSQVDAGPILAQAVCPVRNDDTMPILGLRLFGAAVPLTLSLLKTAPEMTSTGHARVPFADGTEAILSTELPESLREFSTKFVSRSCRTG